MKIWTFRLDPLESSCARAAESPSPYFRDVTCPRCHRVLSVADLPLKIHWNVGSDVIGDFVWVPSALVATERVRRLLEPLGGLSFGPVEFVENPDPRLPKGPPRVHLPYQGPPLFELRPAHMVSFDKERSSTSPARNSCGHVGWRFSGISRDESRYDPGSNSSVRWVVPREPGKGLYVREADLDGNHFFGTIESAGRVLYFTDVARDLILRAGLSNIDFREWGETFSE
jgi:hypothetical protein